MASSLDFWRISKVKLLLFCLCDMLFQIPAMAPDWWIFLVIPAYGVGEDQGTYGGSDFHPCPVSIGKKKITENEWTELAWKVSITAVRSCLAALLKFYSCIKEHAKKVLVGAL